jgi:glucose-1-phosphate thymidylyltransferase
MKSDSPRTDQTVATVILAAGYATRLYPLTRSIPKPLLQVTSSKTVVDFIVDDIVASRMVDKIGVVTNHKFYQPFCRWAARRKTAGLRVFDDGTRTNDDRLGAIGDIDFVARRMAIRGDCLVVGGDNLFDGGIRSFLEFGRAHAPAVSLGVYDIKNKKEAGRFGVVSVARDRRVTAFEEKPARPLSSRVATCLYYFPAASWPMMDKYMADQELTKDAPGNYIRWLMKHQPVRAFDLGRNYWFDIGHLNSYKDVVTRFCGSVTA